MQNQQKLLSKILAKVQYFQDSLSSIYNVTISICNNGEDFTIPSGQTSFCGQIQNKKICKNYLLRMFEEANEKKSLVISRCPFGALVAVAPMECLFEHKDNKKTRFYLILKQTNLSENKAGCFYDDNIDNFRESAELVTNCFDIILSLMKEAKLLEEPQSYFTDDNISKLTNREKEIIRLVSNGMSNQEIASHLIISEHTVKTHISNILKKLELNNRTQIALYEFEIL